MHPFCVETYQLILRISRLHKSLIQLGIPGIFASAIYSYSCITFTDRLATCNSVYSCKAIDPERVLSKIGAHNNMVTSPNIM